MGRYSEFLVIGRHLPTEREPNPTLYRMRLFAVNETVAKSRFWYFVRRLRKMKKATGEIVTVNKVCLTIISNAPDRGEEAHEGEELRHLAPLQLPLGHPQHVQGVPCPQPC